MNAVRIEQIANSFPENTELTEALLWRACQSGGFPSLSSPAKWIFEENVTLEEGILHLRFQVYFTEEAPGCCEDTPQLTPRSCDIYVSYICHSEQFECYLGDTVKAPDWSALFHAHQATPDYEDSFL